MTDTTARPARTTPTTGRAANVALWTLQVLLAAVYLFSAFGKLTADAQNVAGFEAMGFGTCVVANDTPENLETIGAAGFSYSGALGAPGLRDVLERLMKDPALVAEYAGRGRERARVHYSWDAVTDAYEQLLREMTERAA